MPARRRAYTAAFFVPAALYLAVLAAARVIPFGDNTLLLWDANNFYVSFLSYWRGVLAGGHDLWYTFNRALGSSMAGLAAYFLLSPLNWLLLLFPANAMALAYSALVVLKIGLCGLTMFIWLQRRYASGWKGLFFSTSYALCGFMAVYAFHVMWLDALILLPLAALGIHRIVEGGKPFLYIAALWLALVSQYYMGYMLCLFSALYFVYLAGQAKIGLRAFFRRLGAFVPASLLAAGLAAAVLIPAVYTVLRGYSLFDVSLLTLTPVNTALSVLYKAYTASTGVLQLKSGGPNYYVGIPLLVLALSYFACSAVPPRKRLWSLGLLAVFVLSFLFTGPYLVWQAFNLPNYFPARFSFLFSFLLVDLAWQGAAAIPRSGQRRLTVWTVALAAAFLLLTAVLLSQLQYIEYLARKTVLLDAVFFCAACALLLWLRHTKKLRKTALILLCCMQAVGLMLNSYYAIVRLDEIWSATAAEYTQETERGTALVNRVTDADDSLYRMELNFHRTDTDPFAYDYNGLTHFSPDADAVMIDFAKKVGLLQTYYHIRYSAGTTPVLDSLLGVKYLLRKDGISFEPLPEGYTELWTDGGVTAYENTYALPFAYLAPRQTLELAGDTAFENQNILLRDLTGLNVTAFESVWDIERAYDGTWETYTFPVEANKQLYMKSAGEAYLFNGEEETAARMNGEILLPVAAEDTTYTVRMTAPLNIELAYFDLAAFREAQAALAAHAAEVESDTDSHLVIHVDVTDDFTQLLLTLPFDPGWRVWVDGERAETTSRYDALLAVDLTEGAHTVELRFTPYGLWAGAALSGLSLLLALAWALILRRKRKRAAR